MKPLYRWVEVPKRGTIYAFVAFVYRLNTRINVIVRPVGEYYYRLLGSGPNCRFETLEAAYEAAKLYDMQSTEATHA